MNDRPAVLTKEEVERLYAAAAKVKRGDAVRLEVQTTRSGGLRILVVEEG